MFKKIISIVAILFFVSACGGGGGNSGSDSGGEPTIGESTIGEQRAAALEGIWLSGFGNEENQEECIKLATGSVYSYILFSNEISAGDRSTINEGLREEGYTDFLGFHGVIYYYTDYFSDDSCAQYSNSEELIGLYIAGGDITVSDGVAASSLKLLKFLDEETVIAMDAAYRYEGDVMYVGDKIGESIVIDYSIPYFYAGGLEDEVL